MLVVRLFVLLVPMLLALWPARPGAAASLTWCADDLIVSVDGRLVDIQVQVPIENLVTMRWTVLSVVIPRNRTGLVVVDDVSAVPMRTTISPTGPAWHGRGPLPITIIADVTAVSAYPVRVVATPLRTLTTPPDVSSLAYGAANTPLSMPMALR